MQYGMGMLLWSDDVTGAEWSPLFARLRALGFDFVEVPVIRTDPQRFERLGRRLRELGLGTTAVTVLGPEQHLIDADAAVRGAGLEHLRRALDCARALGSPLLGGPIYAGLGVFSGAAPTVAEWQRAVDGLRAAAEHADGAGVTLAAEYLNRFEVYLVNCAADLARLVRAVGHPRLRMTYDTFHAHIEEKDPAAAIRACADVLEHVQASENDRSTPGSGTVAWDATFAALAAAGYRGRLAIEAFGQKLPALAAATRIWRPMFADEETLARQGLAFLRARWEGTA
ncbi:MAG: sugar phosphate isomerase/epimerase [Planctomycetota bacterium]|nr:MAG: sugar phosphate isomerase/epimerase [Planctomycetota bacterium]